MLTKCQPIQHDTQDHANCQCPASLCQNDPFCSPPLTRTERAVPRIRRLLARRLPTTSRPPSFQTVEESGPSGSLAEEIEEAEIEEAAVLPPPQDLLGGRRWIAREYQKRVRRAHLLRILLRTIADGQQPMRSGRWSGLTKRRLT